MVAELKEAIAKVEQLNNEEQMQIAKMIEEEIKRMLCFREEYNRQRN